MADNNKVVVVTSKESTELTNKVIKTLLNNNIPYRLIGYECKEAEALLANTTCRLFPIVFDSDGWLVADNVTYTRLK